MTVLQKVLTIFLVSSLALLSSCKEEKPTQVKLRVMETTDIHANVMAHNYYTGKADDGVGLVKTATLINQARNEATNSVLVDNGDLIQGSPLGDYFAKTKQGKLKKGQVHPIYKAMNMIQYDVANIGNHEFNFGLEYLEEAINDADFPYISANVFKDDADEDESNDVPYFKPYLIQEKKVVDVEGSTHSLKIGYIGFVPPQIMQWDRANLTGRVIAKDIVKMAEKYVPEMKEKGADLVIAIPHSGLVTSPAKGKDEHASYYLSQVTGIDAILFGHAHLTFPGHKSYNGLKGVDNVKGRINGVPAVMPGFWGNHLGYIDLTLNKDKKGVWSVLDSQSVIKPISKKVKRKTVALVDADAKIVEAVQADHEAVKSWVSKPLATISAPINSFFALVQDDPSIQVVTDAQTAYVKEKVKGTDLEYLPILSVGAPFRAGGRQGVDNFTNLPKGSISYGNVADLYIYPNTLKALKLSGAEVKEWLEMSAGQFNQINIGSKDAELINSRFPSYNFDVIDGVSYQIDVSQPAKYDSKGNLVNPDSSRIVDLEYAGKAIDLQQEFLVISNNYRASGGGNFPNINAERIVLDAPDENRQAVANYLILNGSSAQGFDPSADNNWSLKPLPNTTVTVLSSPLEEAKEFAKQSGLRYLKNNADGFGVYRLTFLPRSK